MRVNEAALSIAAQALCALCAVGAPHVAAAQNAAHYWAVNGATTQFPHVPSPYVCVTNYYVSPNGDDADPGTSSAPWQTISGAVRNLAGGRPLSGVCVNVGPGTYTESVYIGTNLAGAAAGPVAPSNVAGTAAAPTGYLVFRSSIPHAAKIQEPFANITTSYRGNIYVDSSRFLIFDGFEITGFPNVPLAGAGGIFAANSQYVWFINNMVHDVGGVGIAAVGSDYINVQGNIVYSTSCCGAHGQSGIDFWAPVNADNNPGFHNIIANNISFNNSEGNDGRSPHTEGHGIILDNFRLGGYTGATLIENNLIYRNGGMGIDVYYSNNVTIRNNTIFDNGRDPLLGYAPAEIYVVNSSNIIGVNNLVVANATTNSNIRTIWDQTWDHTNIGNVWTHNLTFDGNPGEALVSKFTAPYGTPITAANGNVLGSDPLFVNAPQGSFTLQDGSPAIGAGTVAYGVPVFDLAGNVRAKSVIDIGAYASSAIPPS